MPARLLFCPTHRIAFNTIYDNSCPQCLIAHMAPPPPLEFDVDAQKPKDKSGKLLDPVGPLPGA